MRLVTIVRKQLGDLSNPKVLMAYLVPFVGFSAFLALGLAPTTADDEPIGSTVAAQEAWLEETFVIMLSFLGVAIPLLALCAVFCGMTLASELERGTLRIVLSKPIARWKLFVGTFAAIVGFATVVGLANALLTASMLVAFAGASPAAISASIGSVVPVALVFAMVGAAVVTAVGLAIAAVTKDRLQTVLGALVIPAMYFVSLPVRVFAGDQYESLHLYVVDVTYHFGQVFAAVSTVFNGEVPEATREGLIAFSGVYEATNGSIEPTGHLPMAVSVALVVIVGVGAFVVALGRFCRMDV